MRESQIHKKIKPTKLLNILTELVNNPESSKLAKEIIATEQEWKTSH